MIDERVLQTNAQIYLQKMQQKLYNDQEKIRSLKQKIEDSATKIQRLFRKYIFRKKTIAAKKIQKVWRKKMKKDNQFNKKLEKFVKFYSSCKITAFIRFLSKKSYQIKVNPKRYNLKWSKLQQTVKQVMKVSPQYTVVLSAVCSQMSYLHKYLQYDRSNFAQNWQKHQKKQRDWIWQQIKKKWVKKQGIIWINQSQKQINAEKYVTNLMEQIYIKQYEKLQRSQQRLSQSIRLLKLQSEGTKNAFYFSLFR